MYLIIAQSTDTPEQPSLMVGPVADRRRHASHRDQLARRIYGEFRAIQPKLLGNSPLKIRLPLQASQSECVDTGLGGRTSRPCPRRRITTMRGRKNPPLDLTPAPDGAPLTFDTMATTYLEDYVLQRYRTMSTARPRVEHLREFLGGWPVEAITADAVRRYQLHRRNAGRRSRDDQSGDVGAQSDVSVGNSSRRAGTDAALSWPHC